MPLLLRIIRYLPRRRAARAVDEPSGIGLPRFVLLGLAAATVSFWRLGSAALTDTEAFYAEAAREMHLRGDWLTPHFDYARFFDKPPLYYWLELIGIKALGVGETAARLPAAAAFVGTVLLTAAAGALLFDAAAGLVAGLLLACTMGFFEYGHTALVEPLLCFWMTAALVAFLAWRARRGRAALYAVYLAMAFAALTKGLTGIVFPSAVIGLFLLLSGEAASIRELLSPAGIGLFLLALAPWHAWSALRHPGFLWFHFVHEQFLRFSGSMLIVYHPQPTWMFLGSMGMMIFPWSLFAPQAAASCLRDRSSEGRDRAGELFPMVWAGVILGFFCLSRFKLDYYSIPAWPPVLLLVARYFTVDFRSPRAPAGIWLPAAILAGAGAGLLVVLPWAGTTFASSIPDPWLVQAARATGAILLAGGGCAAFAFLSLRPRLGLACLALMMPPIFVLAQQGISRLEPELSSAEVGRAAAACLDRLGSGELVHAKVLEDVYIGSAAFYARRKVWLLKPPAEQSFPFPHRPDEVFYLSPEDFARRWMGSSPVLFIDENAADARRPWEKDASRFHVVWKNRRHRLIANLPVCLTPALEPSKP